MTLRKFAAFDVLEATLAPEGGTALRAYAHRHSFTYEPRPGYLYIRSRAISSRTNDNFDTFPPEEIEKSYLSFIGKPVFVNHNNDNHRRARGVIIDAALHRDKNPDGSPDTWSEVLMEVDAVRFPKLAKAILAGHIDRTSMGTDVAFSKCSFCGNKATTPLEYCKHIPKMKGQRIYRTVAGTNKKEGVLVSEICHGLKFFENSLLVEEPADPTAFFTGVDDHSGMGKAASKTASLVKEAPGKFPTEHEPMPVKTADGYAPGCSQCGQTGPAVDDRILAHLQSVLHTNQVAWSRGLDTGAIGTPMDEDKPKKAPRKDDNTPAYVLQADRPEFAHLQHVGKVAHSDWQEASQAGQMAGEMHEHGDKRTVDLSDPHDLVSHMAHHGYDEADLWRNSHDENHPALPPGDHDDRPLQHDEIRHLHDWEHGNGVTNGHPDYHGGLPGQFLGDSHFHTASKTAKPAASSGHSAPSKRDTDTCATCGKPIYHVEGSASGGWQHDIDGASGVPHQAFPASGKKAASVYLQMEATERKRVSEMEPHELKAFRKHQESGRKWNRDNPAHADNIIAHWNAATEHEKHQGMNWYKDAHELTKHVASDTKTPMHTAAGLMSNYSPQTHWATNMLNAAKSMRIKKGIGGSGSGIFATAKQKRAADRLHAGEHYDKVLSGPKTHAFAHLIEHGGNAHPEHPKVVIDRHALSVASGKRAKDIDYEMSGLGGKKRYKQVADEYHKAAQHISKHTGVKVEAHQVQAATWLVRQRLNAGEDKKMASYGKISNDAVHHWNEYAGEHHPLAMGKEPGTGYSTFKDAPEDVQHSQDLHDEGGHGSIHAAIPPTNPRRKSRTEFGRTAMNVYLAYGETMAPADVDTLRDEECPVCGESDAYDGNRCDVCGFDAPPKMFQDPDLDAAKSMDLRKDVLQDAGADPNGDGMPDVIPGSGQMGNDDIMPDGSNVPDPQDVAQQQMNEIAEDQQPLQPEQLDENGQPVMPPDPMGQPQPADPNALPINPDDIAGQTPMDESGQVEPGTAGDAAADLVCPVCGYQEGAEPPQSVDMASPPEAAAGAVGSLCPNCQQGQLMSIQDADAAMQQQGQNPMGVARASLLNEVFPVFTL